MHNAASKLRRWLSAFPGTRYVPLFDSFDEHRVKSYEPASGKRRLCRSPAMEHEIITMVAKGLERPSWRGLIYVMAWGDFEHLRPLYIGKAGRFGKSEGKLSANLKNLQSDKSKFARWGDGNDYHIGDLSQALYGWSAYKEPSQKYLRWAEVLFAERSPLRLREATSVLLVPWDEGHRGIDGAECSVETAEGQAIDLAIAEFGEIVLNVQGETWWTPAAAHAPGASLQTRPRRPITLVMSANDLSQAAAALAREPVIGLDVETTLYRQELRLVQIATKAQTFIIDPLAVTSLEPLRHAFGPEGPLKVIHSAPFERRILGEAGFPLRNIFDTLSASRQLGPSGAKHGLSAVCERHLGRILDKTPQTSDWGMRPLTPAQLEYAAIDAEVLLDLHQVLERRVSQDGELFSPC